MFLQVDSYKYFYFKISALLIKFSRPMKCNIISLIIAQARANGLVDFNIPKLFTKFASQVDAAPGDMSHEDFIESIGDVQMASSGWLYPQEEYHFIANDTNRDPEKGVLKSSQNCFFPGELGKSLTDCLVHAINFALRYPFYTNREQVIRQIRRSR